MGNAPKASQTWTFGITQVQVQKLCFEFCVCLVSKLGLLTFGPSFLFLGLTLQIDCIHWKGCMRSFIVSLFVRAKTWKPSFP